ncbi:hypothetical protein O9K51_02039 [Purpureocillium lavendulum]|uniref:Uncharacterized protein n=1 Tax=Purpureocillium lavendulum TaxID=1247861 RepID=A0AB34G7B5_9HYPO|nr:hypothetical protein O9K51_02039 [Purpureocillium lavendulum]
MFVDTVVGNLWTVASVTFAERTLGCRVPLGLRRRHRLLRRPVFFVEPKRSSLPGQTAEREPADVLGNVNQK